MLTEKKLLDLKTKIDRSKEKLNELTGREAHLLEQLNDEFDCKTVEAAETKLEEMDTEIAELESKIENGLQELEEKYDIE